ncbi:MAG: flagellar basal-body rod protein FlgG [Planctomycetota bacterium]|jgi:flagellar basal-body rod protein FlgG
MLRAFSTSATGMTAQQMNVDIIANNLANINTTGFKRSQIDFKDLIYVTQQEFGSEIYAGTNSPGGIETGSGVRPAATIKVFTSGEMQNTGRNLDVAIRGDGFFQVSMPDGGIQYTRDGSLQINALGQLVTSTGFQLEPSVSVPIDATSIEIGLDGSVNVTDTSGTISVVGTIQMVRFANPAGLSSQGDNLYAETMASGTPTTGNAGENGFGTLQSGFLEKSNVQMVTELVNLITAQRAYETNSRAIKAGDEMLRTANTLVT